jgi:prevent-host-death family protein
MTTTFSLHEAKSRLSQLVSMAESGEAIEITRHGKVVARLVGANSQPRRCGSGIGSVHYHGAFDLSEAEIDELFHSDLPR